MYILGPLVVTELGQDKASGGMLDLSTRWSYII